MPWRQEEGKSVGQYANFIRCHYVKHSRRRSRRWLNKFGYSFDPDSMNEWFEDGLLYSVSEQLQRILSIRDLSLSDLTFNELVDVAQDAEDLLTLKEKKKGVVNFSRYYCDYQDYETNYDGFVIVHTDGACPGNGTSNAKAGIGVWFGEDHCDNVSEGIICSTPTNSIAEIWAMIRALQIAEDNDIHHLEVRSDSDYLIRSLNSWIFKWLENGWVSSKRQPIMHKGLFRQLLSLMRNMDVQWVHVRREDNTEADCLARQGAQLGH